MMLGHLVFLCLCAAALAAKIKLNKAFIQEVVDRHNEYRAAHGLKPVRANRKVSKYAQSWANYLNNNDLFEHRTQKKYGENLSWMSGNVNVFRLIPHDDSLHGFPSTLKTELENKIYNNVLKFVAIVNNAFQVDMIKYGSGADHVDNLYLAEQQYYETKDYYGKEPPLADFGKYGHYTQIVWENSRKIGVGVAGPVVVINYKPAGNVIGSFKKNVPKPQ